jgi:hypothetical protein
MYPCTYIDIAGTVFDLKLMCAVKEVFAMLNLCLAYMHYYILLQDLRIYMHIRATAVVPCVVILCSVCCLHCTFVM